MVKVAFTGSFDPVHEGHKYVVDFAVGLGLVVFVVVANNVNKVYKKPLDQRLLDAQYFLSVPCIASDATNIGDIIKSAGCTHIIRGLRNVDDFVYEQDVTDFNWCVNDLKTFYVPAPPHLRGVSSTKIKEEMYEVH